MYGSGAMTRRRRAASRRSSSREASSASSPNGKKYRSHIVRGEDADRSRLMTTPRFFDLQLAVPEPVRRSRFHAGAPWTLVFPERGRRGTARHRRSEAGRLLGRPAPDKTLPLGAEEEVLVLHPLGLAGGELEVPGVADSP